ncbi:MAG: 5'/3'-nucleotidase SurE [Devosiaceae bacterium]|nr:5'/3'-nucleotidase SurE [Devosiaceae bacterium MH13]
MRILVTNDDGIHAPGLAHLEAVAAELGAEVWTVAPETDQSGVAHSMSLNDPLRLREVGERRFAVRGTPTDCVLMAVRHVMPQVPDLLLSGINKGQNLAEDITYSGTVAAAIEGTILGVPSIALSQAYSFAPDKQPPYATAEALAPDLIRKLLTLKLPAETLLNINFPDRAPDAIEGVRVTRQGRRNVDFLAIDKRSDGRGNPYYWLAYQGQRAQPDAGTDLDSVRAGYVSVTPLSIDLTHGRVMDDVAGALGVAPGV